MTIQIVMPFWGDASYFKKAVESVIHQSNPDWKLTILDDAYPSIEPQEWVISIADSRITYVRNEVNIGLAANFQQAVDVASEPRVTIMGCDDILGSEYVERISQLAVDFDDDMIHPGVAVIDEKDNVYFPLADRVKHWIRPTVSGPTVLEGEKLVSNLSRGNWMYFPAISWKTERIRKYGFREEYGVVLDLALAFDLLLSGGSLLLDDQIVFNYRRHRHSESSWRAIEGSRFDEERSFLEWSADRFAKNGWPAAARAARLRLTSRLHALLAIPKAIQAGAWKAVSSLTRNALRS